MIAIIDNYDSFTYNLYQAIGAIDPRVAVFKNDQITVSELRALDPSALVLSPGPGRPEQAGVTIEAVRAFTDRPVLGVCLGHQAICAAFGGTIGYAKRLMHGKSGAVTLSLCPLFEGLDSKQTVARYHSLAADRKTLPDCLIVTATADDGEIMAVRHKTYEIYGLQFHPESILTAGGSVILENFLKRRTKR